MSASRVRAARSLGFAALAAAACSAPTHEAQPPSLAYGDTRTSTQWVTTPAGTQVAVDEGVAWRGIKIYLSLTWDLVAVDCASGRTLWAVPVSAFWNEVGFRELEASAGTRVWTVELRPGARATQGHDQRQYHDLMSGQVLAAPTGPGLPAGTAFQPRAQWQGSRSNIGQPFTVLVTCEANWQRVRELMFEGLDLTDMPSFDAVDFSREVILVTANGDSFNCAGISCAEAWQDASRLLVRLRHQSFQTMGEGVPGRAWGMIVLPREPDKTVVLEHDDQSYIAGPPLWRETARLQFPQDAARELARLPH